MRKHIVAIAATAALVGGVYLNNASWLARGAARPSALLAHRGIAQEFSAEGVTSDTCTATRIYPPTNPYLENTVASLAASFRAGADIAELDIHPTTDGQFAVFHDWTLDCRTNGHGVTRKHSMRYLKTLDIGYGYTADGAKTFPFRGHGIGQMPSLVEVLAAFPRQRLLLNIKSNDPAEGVKLARFLAGRTAADQGRIMVYGAAAPIRALSARLPRIRTMALKGEGATLQTCLLRYELVGWTGYVPESCRNGMVAIPINYAPWLWGWPNRFVARMYSANTEVFVAGPYSGVSQGLDANGVAALPANYAGGIWTDDIVGAARVLRERGPRRQN